jgi:hypothetical protein
MAAELAGRLAERVDLEQWQPARDLAGDDAGQWAAIGSGFAAAVAGHSNPRVVAAIQEQSEKLLHSMGVVHPNPVRVELAEKLAEHDLAKHKGNPFFVDTPFGRPLVLELGDYSEAGQ